MSSDEETRVNVSGQDLVQAGLGFTLSLAALVDYVAGLGMAA